MPGIHGGYTMRIGKLAKKYGIDTRTIDYYTNTVHILPCKQIPGSNYRDYDDESEIALKKILIFRDVGLSISEITEALKDPSYFTIARLEDHIRKMEQHREEEIKRYDMMIDFANAMKETAMAPLRMIELYKDIPYSEKVKTVFIRAFKTGRQKYEQLVKNEDLDELSDMLIATLSNLKRNRANGVNSTEVNNIFSKLFNRLEKYKGLALYFGLSIGANIDDDIFGIEEECGEGSAALLRDMLQLCADWFLEARTSERICNIDDFQSTFSDRIRELDQKYHDFIQSGETSIMDDVFDLVKSMYEDADDAEMIKNFALGFASSLSSSAEAIANIDEEYGEGFSAFVIDALNAYAQSIDQ